jgi:hypothetical protein
MQIIQHRAIGLWTVKEIFGFPQRPESAIFPYPEGTALKPLNP